MKRQKLFRLPRLYDAGGDLSKPWWVEIGYRDPRDGQMKRKRYQDGFAMLRTKKERYVFAEDLIKNLTVKLTRGWTPLDDDRANQIVYIDELEYHTAAQVYGRKRKANKNIRFYASQYITMIKNTKAPKTFQSYRGKIRELIAWLEKNKLSENDISTYDYKVMNDFFDHLIIDKHLAGRTIEKYRITLVKFFYYLINEKVIMTQPIGNIEIPETDEDYSAMPFLDEDMQLVLPVMEKEDPQLYMAALLQYFCFVRPGDELLKMKIKQINFSARTITIPRNIAKKRKARTIDIPDQMFDVLKKQGIHNFGKEIFVIGPFGRPGSRMIGVNTLRERFNKIRDSLGLSTSYKWYSFKHTGAGKLLESGASIAELMNQLGHEDITSTYRYIRRHFGERSEHVRSKFPSPPGYSSIKKAEVNWLEGISLN